MKNETQKQLIEHAISGAEQMQDGQNTCDVHNELFNADYFIIGYHQAEEFLKATDEGIFGAINLIKDYEQDNFGEVTTDLSCSEKVVNMYAYIKGEEIINECETISENHDNSMSDEDIQEFVKELQAMYDED